MPTVFLSYSRANLDQARQIEERLTALGITVWCDQEKLQVGNRWPKALGEAIAASKVVLLLWSRSAAESEFVELEWCTALALKKPVLPCLLDDAPLPTSLAAVEAVQLKGRQEAVEKIVAAVTNEPSHADEAQTRSVIAQLSEIGAQETSEVLQQAKAAFTQNQWTVQGSVYQAAGDIHISTPPPAQKTVLEKWQTWVAIVVGVLTILTLLSQLFRIHAPALKVQEQTLAGSIWNDAGEPLSGVKVSLLLAGKTLAGETNDLGGFNLRVTAPIEAEVTLIAQRDGYQTEKRYARLGNAGYNFSMRKKAR
jgi:hypothetical protein